MKNKTKKQRITVKGYTRKDGTKVKASSRSIDLNRKRTGKELAQDVLSDLSGTTPLLGFRFFPRSKISRQRAAFHKLQKRNALKAEKLLPKSGTKVLSASQANKLERYLSKR